MRTIKFRGQCSKSNNLVYGDLIHGVGHKRGNMYILPDAINLASIKHCDPLDGVKINPETIGLFTGLHDKNTREIYEGDILMWTSSNPFSLGEVRKVQVIYVPARFWCQGTIGVYLGELLVNEKCEIIGNIYENHELLTN